MAVSAAARYPAASSTRVPQSSGRPGPAAEALVAAAASGGRPFGVRARRACPFIQGRAAPSPSSPSRACPSGPRASSLRTIDTPAPPARRDRREWGASFTWGTPSTRSARVRSGRDRRGPAPVMSSVVAASWVTSWPMFASRSDPPSARTAPAHSNKSDSAPWRTPESHFVATLRRTVDRGPHHRRRVSAATPTARWEGRPLGGQRPIIAGPRAAGALLGEEAIQQFPHHVRCLPSWARPRRSTGPRRPEPALASRRRGRRGCQQATARGGLWLPPEAHARWALIPGTAKWHSSWPCTTGR